MIFKPNSSLELIQKMKIQNINTKNLKHTDAKISIALSGGVDSTLVLSLIRKVKPDLNNPSLSIKFANSVDETDLLQKLQKHLMLNII